MSSGRFITSAYQSNFQNGVYRLRHSPTRNLLQIQGIGDNPPSNLPINRDSFVSGTRKTKGGVIVARRLRVKTTTSGSQFRIGTYLEFPIFRRARWNEAFVGRTGNFMGQSIVIVGKIQEEVT